ncbi:MAG TPA: ABC transporter permease, partial [Devosiaceae bacterium]|nr:ABC transporter permease [Devosiaceae bacterium]
MSDDAAGSAKAESGLVGDDKSAASFEEEGGGPLRQLQGFLHQYPTSIPFIVLLFGLVIFSIAAPGRFLSPFNFSLVL